MLARTAGEGDRGFDGEGRDRHGVGGTYPVRQQPSGKGVIKAERVAVLLFFGSSQS